MAKNPKFLSKRKKRIEKLWEEGWLMEDIAKHFSISRERVSQILGRPMKNK